MAAFNLSPSVDWEERDYSLVASSVADVIGAIVGGFQWGPVEDATLLTGGEDELFAKFGGTTNQLNTPYLVAADFMQYSSKMQVVRVVGDTARNAVPVASPAITPKLIKNDEEYERDLTIQNVPFIGKYPGTLANNAIVSIGSRGTVDGENGGGNYNTFPYASIFDYKPDFGRSHVVVSDKRTSTTLTGAITFELVEGRPLTADLNVFIGDTSISVSVPNTDYQNDVRDKVYDALVAENNPLLTVSKGWVGNQEAIVYEFQTYSFTAQADGYAFEDGVDVVNHTYTTGYPGDVLEVFEDVELVNTGAIRQDGSAAFIADVMKTSQILRCGEDATFDQQTYVMTGGVDDNGTDASPIDILPGLDVLRNPEKVDFQFLIAGNVLPANQKDASDVATHRRDCMSFVSPQRADVFNTGNEVESITTWRNQAFNKASSYDVIDGNWAQVYDRRMKRVRWIPCCGGTAGLVARTWYRYNPWESPAFHNRGGYQGYRKLAWSPDKAHRDFLYKDQINPIVNMSGEGILLYGDKTGLSKNSAFGSINIRSLFIIVEKTIANMSKYFLGEINDEFTRSQFLNTVKPYLRSIQQRRGIEEFKVICDERNNTGQAIASKEFHANFLIKPAYTINFIKLSFAAVRPDVSFEEIESALYGE